MARKTISNLAVPREPNVELEAYEEPLDILFPRFPNVVSRDGHRAVRIKIRIEDRELIPANATAIVIDVDVFGYGAERRGRRTHAFRHRSLWGLSRNQRFPLRPGHGPIYLLDVVVARRRRDDHLGEGPYEAVVAITPQGPGLVREQRTKRKNTKEENELMEVDTSQRVTIRFVAV
jgi:hypothetical protein